MQTVIKHIVSRTYKPLLEKYLSKTRTYRYGHIRLQVPPEVFHPGFFFSTKILLRYCCTLPLKQTKFLELGCGSGLIAIAAAQKGAMVTATDINPVAVQTVMKNAESNTVNITTIESDLFEKIPHQQFDMIAINPPYYKKQPLLPKDHAWCCGEHGEYFERLFASLHPYIHGATKVLMILFDGCDIPLIEQIAAAHGFTMHCVQKEKNLLEQNFIYQIQLHI
ncbi:MAG: methyltransferase [Bacteroidetes bacterium]|nr:methyltransferase [Bacteroidota bacterium]